MERAMRALMGNNLPPRFKFKDTYDSIEVPTAYQQHLPSQATLEAKFDELIAEEEEVAPTTQIKADMIVSSNLEVGTSNLLVDTETGNVGIGTASPQDKLHVANGHIRIDTDKALTMTSTDTFTYDGGSMPHYGLLWRSHTAQTGSKTMQISGHAGVRMFTAGGERLSILKNGNVGIGTNTGMTEKLSVNGNIDLTPVYGDQGDTNKSGMIIFNKPVGGSIDTTTNIDSIYYDDSQNAYHFTKDTTKYATGNARLVCGTLTTGVITRTAYNPGEIIETLQGRADGSSIQVLSGTYTLQNVPSTQDVGTGHTVITGSSISYKPPPGTTRVIYEFHVYVRHKDPDTLMHFAGRLGGTQVSHSRHTFRARDNEQQWVYNNMTITIGEVGSDNLAAGKLASWTTNKTLDFTARDYTASYEGYLHRTNHWDGGGTDITVTPVIKITAIA
jgi:hypothetical protein